MTPKAIGGTKPLRRQVGLLFGTVFLIASIRWLLQGWADGVALWPRLGDSRFWLVALISGLFFAGLKVPRLQAIDPYIFLVIAVIPFFQSPESIAGFGLFAVGAILLLVDGQLSRQPIPKLAGLTLYLLSLVVGSSIVTKASFETATGLLLFMAAFFLFLFLTFQDKIIVFVKAYKPVLRLSQKGLSEKEASHLLGLLAGKTTKEIAFEHDVKESTIRNSLSRAYRRLGFTDKTQLLQWAEGHDIRP